MVLITDGERRVLLARKPAWPPDRYSATCRLRRARRDARRHGGRETREEVGVEVRNIRYFGSQPWPFPHSLMIAFTAEYAGGEVRPDGVEIEEARWFDADDAAEAAAVDQHLAAADRHDYGGASCTKIACEQER